MNIDPAFARRAVLVLWMGALGLVVYREFGNPNNVDRPLPRPCKLIPPSIGYTALGMLAELSAPVAFALALTLTVGELIQQNPVGNILEMLAGSIQRENELVAQAR